jgi:ferrous iron transport protein B
MGLTTQSTWFGALRYVSEMQSTSPNQITIALAGNPNTGKSTVFNSLTGLKQHTGNWPGKTVANAKGQYTYKEQTFTLVDLPGTYSLLANSVEEEVARDFICFGNPQATVVVTDATCLERNLNLVLQVLEITDKVVVCVNLIDEAKRKKIHIDLRLLSKLLGVPVVGTNARNSKGLDELKDAVYKVINGDITTESLKVDYSNPLLEKSLDMLEPVVQNLVEGKINSQWLTFRLLEGDEAILDTIKRYTTLDLKEDNLLSSRFNETLEILETDGIGHDDIRDTVVSAIVKTAEHIAKKTIHFANQEYNKLDRAIDSILTSKHFGIPIMIALLGIVFWITIQGANYPSDLLTLGFSWIETHLSDLFMRSALPSWVHGTLILGVYRTLAWVISVMLPPMAIFFPLFTLLEDLGYLPRVAFNLDNFFKKACTHGKQALTMCMGFGCNAAGVIACRIIDSPRERLIAIITNNFVPCNGRFPTLIALATIFIGGAAGRFQSIAATLTVLTAIILGVLITLAVSRLLSATILKGLPSSFTLELPPYRKPQIGRILVRSLLDRTLFVLTRAIIVAAPAGLIIWLMANLSIQGISMLDHIANFLQPVAYIMGLDGHILMAFILGFPANEIVIPIIIMSYMSTGTMLELDSLEALRELLTTNGWTCLTALCAMLFSLNHFPCGTTLITIKKETQSVKWTLISFLIPTLTGFALCVTVAGITRLLGFA